jgi:hypothetical protein
MITRRTSWCVRAGRIAGSIASVNVGLLLAVVISAAVLLVCLVVATAVVLRAVRAASRRLEEVFGELRWVTKGSERSVRVLADMQHTVTELVSRSTQIAELVSRSSQPEESRRSTEVSDSRIVAELNHALQTPLRGLGYAVQNLARVSDELLLQERTKRLADLTAMLDSCTSTLATFRGLADTVASVPARQPSLDEAIRVFSDSIPRRSSEPVTVEFAGLPDRVASSPTTTYSPCCSSWSRTRSRDVFPAVGSRSPSRTTEMRWSSPCSIRLSIQSTGRSYLSRAGLLRKVTKDSGSP